MLDFDVKPGKCVGEFKIGMPLPHAISYIQKNYKNIPTVELKYCEEDLLRTCILIDLVEEGMRLKFEPCEQRLLIVEVYDLTKLTLRYAKVAFCGPDINPTFVLIYSRFGPSFPGTYDKRTRTYDLHYPGISFSFKIPEGHELPEQEELPLEFADGHTPSTTNMRLYHGPRESPTLPPLPKESNYFEEVHVLVSRCIYFTKRRCKLDFYSTAQDVISELGRPDRIYNKLEDKMRIHSGDKSSDIVCEDYFYNYFQLGLDILFDMRTHVVKKFIMHTNFPCHYDFNVYVKCNYRLFFEESPFFGRPISDTPVSSPDNVFPRKNGTKVGDKQNGGTKENGRAPKEPVDETRNSLAVHYGGEGEEEEEEGSLRSRKKGRGRTNSETSKNNEEEETNNEPLKQSALGDALAREGIAQVKEEQEREDQEGNGKEKPKEQGKRKGRGKGRGKEKEQEKRREEVKKGGKGESQETELDEDREGQNAEEILSVSPATTFTTPQPAPETTLRRDSREKGKEKVRTFLPVEIPRLIDPNMQWDEIKELLPGPAPSQPVVNSVGASGSPFGSTRFFGCKDIIFEVMRNQHVASVCLFSTRAQIGGK